MLEKHVDFWPLRYRPASGDDPDYDALGLPPNTGIYTVAAAEAGNFVHRLTDLDGNTILEITVAFDTDEAGTAAAMAAAINTAAAVVRSPASRYFYGASSDAAAYYVHYKQMPEFLVENDAPGAATITATPGNRWPMAAQIYAGPRVGGFPPSTTWEFKVKAVDADGNFIPNVGSYTAQVLCGDPYRIPPDTTVKWDSSTRGTLSGNVGEVHRVEVNGTGEITLLLTSLADIDGDADQLIIDAHPVVV